jgi:hypothetical protein
MHSGPVLKRTVVDRRLAQGDAHDYPAASGERDGPPVNQTQTIPSEDPCTGAPGTLTITF